MLGLQKRVRYGDLMSSLPEIRHSQPPSEPQRLTRFHDLHRGQRCVIVCNGPSLNKMDLSALRGEIVIGLNKIYLGLDRFGFWPRYLVAVNDKVVWQSAQIYRAMTAVKFIPDRMSAVMPADAFTYHIHTDGLQGLFYPDITTGVREGHTVTHAALQIAYYMGFSKVVIVGMDHRFAPSGPPNSEQHMTGADPNHFSPDYFRDQAWDAPNLEGSERSYRAALAAYHADGREIIDATVDGGCTVFPKLDYREVLAA